MHSTKEDHLIITERQEMRKERSISRDSKLIWARAIENLPSGYYVKYGAWKTLNWLKGHENPSEMEERRNWQMWMWKRSGWKTSIGMLNNRDSMRMDEPVQ